MSAGGAVRSDVASVEVRLGPLLTLQPTNRVVAVGTNLTLRAGAIGTGVLSYQWLFNDIAIPAATNASLNLLNVLGASLSAPLFGLVVLPDTDGDHIPDEWELAHGLDPQTPEGALDSDGDRVSNRDEYLADIDPQSVTSQLKLGLRTERSLPVLDFVSRSNHTYTVQYADTLSPPVWERLADVVSQSSNRVESVIDTAPGGGPALLPSPESVAALMPRSR